MALVVCRACSRHRRGEAENCPFCGEQEIVIEGARLVLASASRAALVFGGVALGASMSMGMGCVSKGDVYGAPPPPPHDAGTTFVTPAPPYGEPPPPDVRPVVPSVSVLATAGPPPPPSATKPARDAH